MYIISLHIILTDAPLDPQRASGRASRGGVAAQPPLAATRPPPGAAANRGDAPASMGRGGVERVADAGLENQISSLVLRQNSIQFFERKSKRSFSVILLSTTVPQG